MIRGRRYGIPLSRGDLRYSVNQILEGLLNYTACYSPPKSSGEKRCGKLLSPLGASFFLLVVLAKHTWGGAAELEKLFFIQKCLTKASRQSPVCQRVCPSHGWDSERATKQGQALQINPKPKRLFKHTHAYTLTAQSCWVGYRFSVFFFSFSFLMEKEKRKMKSIFNVYHGARLNSLHSAETILNKLIFNEQPLCMRAK